MAKRQKRMSLKYICEDDPEETTGCVLNDSNVVLSNAANVLMNLRDNTPTQTVSVSNTSSTDCQIICQVPGCGQKWKSRHGYSVHIARKHPDFLNAAPAPSGGRLFKCSGERPVPIKRLDGRCTVEYSTKRSRGISEEDEKLYFGHMVMPIHETSIETQMATFDKYAKQLTATLVREAYLHAQTSMKATM